MKTKILTLMLISLTMFSRSGNVELGWLPSCADGVIGYKIYYGAVTNTVPTIGSMYFYCNSSTELMAHYDAVFTNVVVAFGVTNTVISNLVGGVTYVFAATAYDTQGNESDFSSEVLNTIPLNLITNAGRWGGITNWPAYTNGGAAPSLSFAPYDYDIKWVIPPTVNTNCKTYFVTNNFVIKKMTNCWTTTNYSSFKVRNYLLKSDMVIKTNWTVQASDNLVVWTNYLFGSNSPVYTTVINQGGSKFFRIKF